MRAKDLPLHGSHHHLPQLGVDAAHAHAEDEASSLWSSEPRESCPLNWEAHWIDLGGEG